MRESVRRGIAAALLVGAAVGYQRAATTAWATSQTADGGQLQLTPVGLSLVHGERRVDCRWWPRYGDAQLCAQSPHAGAGARVRWAYPLLVLALWCSVAAMFLIALQIPRKAGVRLACSIVAVAFGAGGILVMLRDVPAGLAAFQGITATFGRVGSWSAAIAAGLGLVAAGLQLAGSGRSIKTS